MKSSTSTFTSSTPVATAAIALTLPAILLDILISPFSFNDETSFNNLVAPVIEQCSNNAE